MMLNFQNHIIIAKMEKVGKNITYMMVFCLELTNCVFQILRLDCFVTRITWRWANMSLWTRENIEIARQFRVEDDSFSRGEDDMTTAPSKMSQALSQAKSTQVSPTPTPA